MVLLGCFCVNHLFTIVVLWFGRIQGPRNQCKLMKNACENRTRKRYAELNENETRIEPKFELEIVNISKNTRKMASWKRCEKKCRMESPTKTFECRSGGAGGLISGWRGVRGGFSFLIQF